MNGEMGIMRPWMGSELGRFSRFSPRFQRNNGTLGPFPCHCWPNKNKNDAAAAAPALPHSSSVAQLKMRHHFFFFLLLLLIIFAVTMGNPDGYRDVRHGTVISRGDKLWTFVVVCCGEMICCVRLINSPVIGLFT